MVPVFARSVRIVTCPEEWGAKMVRKVQATRELYGKVMGTIDTPEKFRENRLRLAEREWRRMQANDSKECRNCHNYSYFDYSVQGRRSVKAHQEGFAEGLTCIDCHKGIAHQLPPIQQDIGIGIEGAVPIEVFHPPK
jgi:cytochrome c-type protein NapC